LLYLDASALVKLVLPEPESAALAAHLAELPPSVTSIVAAVEVPRAGLAPGTLDSLDAIHLASALSLRDVLEGFVAYDRRLCAAARSAGLRVLAPG